MRVVLVALVCSASFVASAGHYDLVDIPDVVPAAHHAALQKAGIRTSRDLYDKAAGKDERAALSATTGIAYADLYAWARFIDLMQVQGIGPKMVKLLNAAGVTGLAELQSAAAEPLHERARLANVGNKYSEVVPPPDVIGAWIGVAKSLRSKLTR